MNLKNFLILISLIFSFINYSISSKVEVVFKGYSPKKYNKTNTLHNIRTIKRQVLTNNHIAKNVIHSKKNKKQVNKKKKSSPVKQKHDIKKILFSKPINGKITKDYMKNPCKEGIEITSKQNIVKCSADGVVLYSGNQLIDYNTLVIIKHNEKYLTVYGYLNKSFVKRGQKVRKGENLGKIHKKLYYEIRYNKKPVDPKKFLHF